MLSLKNHPFAVETFFESSLVLTFALPKEDLQHLIPECLSLDTFNDTWAFVAVAMVSTQKLRPKGFPVFMGNDFFLIGFRIFVRYTTTEGKRLRGLYILKSETDNPKMSFFGNIFTHYNYTTTDIDFYRDTETMRVLSQKSDLEVVVQHNNDNVSLPPNSPFNDWKEARRFAGPLPFTFTYNKANKQVLIIEGVRENWTPKPVAVTNYKVGFMQQTQFKNAVLANAFIVENIPYCWKKGRIETWKS